MKSISQIKTGLSQYVDAEILPKLQDAGFKKVIFVTGASLLFRRLEDIFNEYRSNTFLKMLNVFDDAGNVDVDVVIDELRKQTPATGISIDIPLVGEIVLYSQDLDTIHRYINNT